MSILFKFLRFLKSIKLAVIVLILLGVISAVGTIIEAKYDAPYAQQMVYKSPYMYAIMILLSINLIAVMVDRWPWKKRHTAFILAHIGIILVLIGSVLTQRLGVDGSLAFEIGETNRYVSVPERELSIWSSFTGEGLVKLAHSDTNFLVDPPESHPFALEFGNQKFEVLDYHHYAVRQSEVRPSDKASDGPGVRFQLQNSNVNLSDWLVRPALRDEVSTELGPAKVVLSSQEGSFDGTNKIVLSTTSEEGAIRYQIFTQSQHGQTASGLIREGEVIQTGWMGLEFRILRYLPKAREIAQFTPRETPSKVTTSAMKFRFDGEEHWMGVNTVMRLFSDNEMYMVSWGNKRIDLGFDMKLVDFKVGRYQGTQRAASYESEVEVPGKGQVTISMNEPLKYNGFTFYQASFEQDQTGNPVASILSVNYDPGRALKYFGSLLVVLGSIMLFYFKKFGQKKKPASA